MNQHLQQQQRKPRANSLKSTATWKHRLPEGNYKVGITNTIVGNFGISVCWDDRLLQAMAEAEVMVVVVKCGGSDEIQRAGINQVKKEYAVVVNMEKGKQIKQ